MKSNSIFILTFVLLIFSSQSYSAELNLITEITTEESSFRPAALFRFSDLDDDADFISNDGDDEFGSPGSGLPQYFFFAGSGGAGGGSSTGSSARCTSFEGNLSGRASFYGPGFEGKKTACGNTFTSRGLTAAIRQGQLTRSGAGSSFKCGSLAKVTNKANGKVIWVTLNDTGGLPGNRVIDLSRGAANELGFIEQGVTNVTVQICPAG